VALLIVFGGAIFLILLCAFLLDLQDRRHGRKSRMRLGGWLQREGRFMTASSAFGYWMGSKGGVRSVYSTKDFYGDDEKHRPRPD
jgi:hypothetical protein